jgi:hypothetical protein
VTKATAQGIRNYAQLMVSSHIRVNNATGAILKKKALTRSRSPTLLGAAYSIFISTLEHENGQTSDNDHVKGQVNYGYEMDRLSVVLSGTWWVNSGADFDPNNWVPVPAGGFVRRVAHTWHYDGVKRGAQESAVIAIFGDGPVNLKTGRPTEAELAMGVMSTRMTSLDRMPRDGHTQHILHSLGGRLCGS